MDNLDSTATPYGAIFSDCRQYRYMLWRRWDESKPAVMFIGLNPSTANEDKNDPTINKVVKFAKAWGYGCVYMLNLFALVSPYPEDLKKCEDPVADNDYWLSLCRMNSEKVIFAWGNFDVFDRDKKVIPMFPDAEALTINKNGSPRHPLYVPRDVIPIKYPR